MNLARDLGTSERGRRGVVELGLERGLVNGSGKCELERDSDDT